MKRKITLVALTLVFSSFLISCGKSYPNDNKVKININKEKDKPISELETKKSKVQAKFQEFIEMLEFINEFLKSDGKEQEFLKEFYKEWEKDDSKSKLYDDILQDLNWLEKRIEVLESQNKDWWIKEIESSKQTIEKIKEFYKKLIEK